MIWLLRLYPEAWRKRYGEEFAAILAGQHASLGLIMDVLGGAVDAHLHPQIQVQQSELTKGDTMTAEIMKRCAAGGPTLSKQEQIRAVIGMLLSSLVLAAIYAALRKIYHNIPAVEALGYTIFPAMLLFYGQMAYLRKRNFATQLVLMVIMMGVLFLIMWAVSTLAANLAIHSRTAELLVLQY